MSTAIDPEYQEILAAWQRAKMIKGVNQEKVRIDLFGRVIWFDEYDQETEHGWRAIVIDPNVRTDKNEPRLEAVQWQPFPTKKLKVV